jgi:hypothetical protein
MKRTIVCFVLLFLAACGGILDPERAATEKLLGVKVKDLPSMTEFDEADPNAPTFKAMLSFQGETGGGFESALQPRSSVYATAPDGSLWEAYCGKAGAKPVDFPELNFNSGPTAPPTIVEPYKGFDSTPANTRQNYDTHHGYSFNPLDIFIGRSENGRLATSLFFRDVGSHTTAPHHMAIDRSGNVNLVVADVNISDDNSLDLYWMVGSMYTGKWTSAHLIDHRGFTSISKVWNGAYHDKVHLVWSWDSGQNKSPDMGIYHIEKDPSGFSRKVRIFKGEVFSMSAAIDLDSGRLLVAFTNNDDAYAISKEEGGSWSRPTPMKNPKFRNAEVTLLPGPSGSFDLKVNDMNTVATWRIQPE